MLGLLTGGNVSNDTVGRQAALLRTNRSAGERRVRSPGGPSDRVSIAPRYGRAASNTCSCYQRAMRRCGPVVQRCLSALWRHALVQ